MNSLKKINNKEAGLLLQRVSISVLILFHGIANLTTNYSFIKSLLSSIGIPEFVAYSVFIGEIVAPILIIIGWKTRLASFILAFNMLVAILMAHSGDIFALNKFGGWAIELQGLYMFGAIAIYLSGAGKYALSNSTLTQN